MYNLKDRTITADRLILWPFELSDAERVYELCNNYNVFKSTLTLPFPYPLECAISWIQTHEENYKRFHIG
ncbi:GNAT family N-acetyltransferase [Paenibacillus sp. GSMTC-2017]|uniref:GNAT family N-acetyltransferase n=1 Tax=Paenibacillus sp. GSMTC-2017 TaxID=2794350 RepID=UPI002FBE484B